MLRHHAVVACLALAVAAHAQGTMATAPSSLAGLEGLSWHFKPYNDTNMRYQQLFEKKELSIPAGKTIFATSFRTENRFTATYKAKTLNVSVWLVETPISITQMTNNFKNNYGGKTPTKVFSGKLNLPALSHKFNGKVVGQPLGKIMFTTPFKYGGGNLLTEIINADPNKTNTAASYNVDRHFDGSTSTTQYTFHGVNCPTGKNGHSIFTTNMKPGGSMRQRLTVSSGGRAFMLVQAGNSPAAISPIDIGAILGAPAAGCYSLVNLAGAVVVDGPNTTPGATWDSTIPIPNQASLAGNWIHDQHVVLDAATPRLGANASASRFITATGGHTGGYGYMYRAASGDPTTFTTALGPFRGSVDVQIFWHN